MMASDGRALLNNHDIDLITHRNIIALVANELL